MRAHGHHLASAREVIKASSGRIFGTDDFILATQERLTRTSKVGGVLPIRDLGSDVDVWAVNYGGV